MKEKYCEPLVIWQVIELENGFAQSGTTEGVGEGGSQGWD